MTDAVLPAWFTLSFAALLGAVIGSFLNVVIWRVPQRMSIAHPPSACPQCQTRIAWHDNIPVLSYLTLRGRCRHCDLRISPRYPLIELGTAVAFVGVLAGAYADAFPASTVPVLLYWSAIGIALAAIDTDHHRLPDVITLPAYAVTAALLVLASTMIDDYGRLLTAAFGLAVLGGLYLLLALGYPGGMGFGDVKLAGSVGMLLGWLGWPQLIVGGFSAFVIGGLVGVGLMLSGRANRRSGVPFGPFMLAGAAVGVFAGPAVAGFYLSVSGLT